MSERPFPLEDLLASIVEALKVRGDVRAITAIAEGNCWLQPWESENGIDYWRLLVELPVYIYYALSEEERKAAQESIEEIGRSFFGGLPQDGLGGVLITPLVAPAHDAWRNEAMRFVKGEGVTNQGRVRSDNIAAKQHKGLLFRSDAEITLFEALTRARLAISPLPVFIRISNSYNRIEPDFVVVYKGLTFVVEVDGDSYHRELPAEADKRLVPLTSEGVEVRRIRASELTSTSAADSVVRDLIEFMKSRKESR